MYIYIFIYIYIYVCMYICNHENNVLSRLSPKWFTAHKFHKAIMVISGRHIVSMITLILRPS